MALEHEHLSDILKKMDTIATERYGGDASANAYSIYMQLTDIERIHFLSYSYRICKAIVGVVDFPLSTGIETKGKSTTPVKDDEAALSLADRDKSELVKLKHNAIITAGQVILFMLGLLIVGVIFLSILSPELLKVIGKLGPVISVIVGG